MPKDVDFGPDDYRVESKSGRWVNRDDFRVIFLVGIPMLAFWVGYAWWHRAEISLVLLISVVGFFCLGIGVFLGAWLKRFD
jgi:hypothetical protein